MIIYITLNEGYVEGWSSNKGENDVKMNISKYHDFFKTDMHCWKYEDGKLAFDENKQHELINERKKEESKPSQHEINEMALLELAGVISEMKGGS